MTTLASGTDTLTRDALTVLQPGFTGTSAPDWLLRRLGEGLASVGLFGRNIASPAQLGRLTAQLRAERDDVLVAIDEEGGDVTRLEVRTGSSFPGNHALGAVDDVALTREVAFELGRRLAECGVNLNWAPSADVNSNPGNPVIGVRSFGADTDLVARHTAAYVTGLQAAGVAACTKHFPGHGDTAVDSHHALPRIDVDASVLHARELAPFRAAIAAGSRAVMSAHILVPALDPDRPATLSRRVLTGLLREELGYQGLIVTDGMEMQAIAGTYGIERGSVLAIAAGADAICVGGGLADDETVRRLRDALVSAVRSGELAEERLADAAERVRALARWTASASVSAQASAAASGSAPEAASDAASAPGGVSTGMGAGAGPGSGAGHDIGLVAARRALTVTCSEAYEPVGEPPFVAVLTPVANIAVGDETPWGVAAELARLLPGTETGSFAGGEGGNGEDTAPAALTAAGDRRIVAVVRDEHRHAWMASALDALLAARPDTIVVEMGVPQATPRGALHIATHGAARVCGRAAAEIIAGH
ncbi:sugar hydrolase [Streptomyces avermitilis]|uniref:Beta-N-acetylhexosaminidase n=2 Tax=Streptomyces avermitilis TaxID=33903 RepID=Q82IW4_STRAW|nr:MULTISPECIES: glycoside hydrolase family 3 protein [Streptomyces]KUN56242.1 sugar hydrolase [Streptomyces avermitilis]MYS98618.1 glycoside hydrolase family 3 protein [Streptomyces sp. SID5469]OOV33030.1 sugar hydrolase [Streptomyces avermitilis]BAC70730.1 putative beta-N-acetylhexosaminidase [Streptomyces avermitilis MA-4680 = NBRC 14893]BBJ50866.1 sugar hydrolase [Streptomyces avermitilis]